MNLTLYHQFCTEIAYKAGRITLGYFNTGILPEFKQDDSPVTAADRAAESYIRTEIESRFPNHSVLGEEFGQTGSLGNSFRWIIDPIDGTKSFMRGVPLYAVLIGLEIDGVIQVGAAYYPGTDEMLCASTGNGAWWNGKRAKVSAVDNLSKAYVCYTNIVNMARYGRSKEWERIASQAFTTRGWSDAYGYLLVGTGRAEVMLDPVMSIWDCAPFPVILKEAGGAFGSWSGVEGHNHGEAIATNQALFKTITQLINSQGS